VGCAALALFAMSAAVLTASGAGEEGVRALIRATARTSLAFFLAAFSASSARRLWQTPATAWWLRNRRQLGVSFAVSHALHLAAIVALAAGWPDSFRGGVDAVTLVGGGFGYAMLAAMAATSSDAAVRALGARRWRLLHRVGIWTLFLIFASNYLPAPLHDARYAPAALALVGALALRVAAAARGRRRVTAGAP
jgi:DMSO/TMAO reductase YedYZ heme-binding membrane subunit